MKVIYKYKLIITDSQVIDMPPGEILTVQLQDGQPVLWTLVNEKLAHVKREVEFFGTGHDVPDGNRKYIGTFQQSGFVWHVFERLYG